MYIAGTCFDIPITFGIIGMVIMPTIGFGNQHFVLFCLLSLGFGLQRKIRQGH